MLILSVVGLLLVAISIGIFVHMVKYELAGRRGYFI